MASERDAARGNIADQEQADPDLNRKLTAGHELQIAIDREANRSKEALAALNVGWFGKVFGNSDHAPTVVAAVVVVFGFVAFFCCLIAASWYQANPDFWAKQGERGIGIATAALAYIFGRGSGTK
jgi:hypothetical protein